MESKLTLISGAPGAPRAVGPYSQGVAAGNLVFLSGQIPLDPSSGKIVEGAIDAQIEQVMKNIQAVLKHCALGFESVIKTTIFVTDLKHFQTVNEIYSRWMGDHKPARSTVQVAGLPLGAQVEIEMIAAR
jgi:2-iminobutanoate/2-iminopropanoate deaminase